MQKDKQINVQIECIINDLHLLQPTKQFKNSVKETYNAKLMIPTNDTIQMDELQRALNDAIENGKMQYNWDDTTKLVYPTKNETNNIIIVACTFFKPKIIDVKSNQLNDDAIKKIEENGQFYGIVDLSFYPYAKYNNGIGTNLNAIMFIDYKKPMDNEAMPFDTEQDIKAKQNKIQEQKDIMKQPQPTNINQNDRINHIAIECGTNTYNFDLFKGTNESNNTIFVVQEKSQPNIYNVAIYNNGFDYENLLNMIKLIESHLNNGTLWKKETMPKSILSQKYKWAKIEIAKRGNEQKNIN